MKNWEEMFDEKYPSLSVWDDEDIADEVKDFIRHLIRTEKLKVLDQVKLEPITYELLELSANEEGYNIAVKEINAIREKVRKNI